MIFPAPLGVISAVYVVPEPAKFDAVPLATVMSPTTKPVTASLKVIVTGNGVGLFFVDGAPVIATVGAVAS